MEVNLIGLTSDEIEGILHPFIDPEMPLLEKDLSQAILRKVSEVIYLNNEKITEDLAKASIFIPD